MSEARADGSRIARRVVFGLGEAMAWGLLIALSLLGLNGVALVLGLMALILPGLLLLLFPNLLMVLVLIQPARWVWHWSRLLVVPTAALGLSVLGIIPMISNARLDRAVVAEQAEDFDRATPAPVRSVLLLGGYGLDCDETCRRLLDAGVPTVAVGLLPRSRTGAGKDAGEVDLSAGFEGPTARYSLGDEGDCKACILRTDGPGGQADLILSTTRRDHSPDRGRNGAAVRYDPFDKGAFVARRTEAWACTSGATCRRILRSTSVSYEPLWPVLVLGVDSSSYDLYMWRGWQRAPLTAGETDLATIAGRLAVVTPPAEPVSRTVRASLEGVKRELAVAATEGREPVVPTLGEALQGLAGPNDALTDAQLAFLRTLVRHPTLDRIPFNWTAHPEAALKLAPDLGTALERSGDRSNFGRSVQGALATLPDEAFVRLKASILRWLGDAPHGEDFEHATSRDFVLRLSELGPDFARVAASRAEPGWPESAAMSGALCRLGPQGRPALAALKAEQARIVEKRYQRNAALERAIASIEDGTVDRDDCYRGR